MSTSKNGDCGCGCGGAKQATSVAVAGADAHVRPRFFAGQLLTEDDLGQLGDYVVNKNRLHNRGFFGEGVVCGLEVTCDPCGDGHVSVRPGYALDCCGNDIVVPCAQTLDVNAMAHRLRVESLNGVDCGDPCASEGGKDDEDEDEANGVVVMPARRRYSLYVSYAEEDTDPVAPYATGEPCGAQGCEPTRTRESHKLSLRCEAERRPADDLLSRIARCVKSVEELVETDGGRGIEKKYADAALAAVAVRRGEERLEFTAADAQAMKAALAEAEKPLAAEPSEQAVRTSLDRLRTLVMTAGKLNAIAPADRAKAIESFELADQIPRARDVARSASEQILPHVARIREPLEQEAARALAEGAATWIDPDLPADVRSKIEHQLAVQGATLNRKVGSRISGNLAAVRDRLLVKLDTATLTDCRLRRDVEAIRIPLPAEPSEDEDEDEVEERTIKQVVDTSTASRALASALIRYMAGCLCAALLPPCRPCDDLGVLLATIEVEGCEVVHVCNLERTIPLTGTALGHWVPVQHLARLLDEVCCVLPRKVGELGKEQPMVPSKEREITLASTPSPQLFSAPPDVLGAVTRVGAVLGTAGVSDTLSREVTRAVERLPDLGALRAVAEPARAIAAPEIDRLARLEERLRDVTTLKRDLTNLRKRNAALEKQVKDLAGGK